MEYKQTLIEECMLCVKHLGLSYSDVMKMPTYERRYWLIKTHNDAMDAEEKRSTGSSTVKTGKHTRTTKFSPR